MRYKVGDEVRIKEHLGFTLAVRSHLGSINPPYEGVIVKVLKTTPNYYRFKGMTWLFKEEYIEDLVSNIIPVSNRWELLDIR